MDLVSVIIPTYRGQKHLKRAIDSVMLQEYDNIEIIVVDDNNPTSDDRIKTEEVIKSLDIYNLTYIQHEKNKNGAAARNTGIAVAKGKYICFLDDDDFMLPQRVRQAVDFLELNTGYSGICCGVIFIHGQYITGKQMVKSELTINDFLFDDKTIGSGSNLFLKTDCVKSVGGFDESFIRHQDVEFMIRILEKYKIGIVNDYSIVKCQNVNSNIPNYNKFLKVKKLFHDKFETHINQLCETDKQKYYIARVSQLYDVALTENIICIIDARKKLLIYRKLTFRENVLFVLGCLGIVKQPWFSDFLSSIKRKKKVQRDPLIYALFCDKLYEE